MVVQEILNIKTNGRETIDLTRDVEKIIKQSKIMQGICNVFIQHTSASLMLSENADPDVRVDLETFMSHLVQDGDPMFRHNTEGQDDMPAHVRTVLTDCSLSIPVNHGHSLLGTWQGIYLWEHRSRPRSRRLAIHLGE